MKCDQVDLHARVSVTRSRRRAVWAVVGLRAWDRLGRRDRLVVLVRLFGHCRKSRRSVNGVGGGLWWTAGGRLAQPKGSNAANQKQHAKGCGGDKGGKECVKECRKVCWEEMWMWWVWRGESECAERKRRDTLRLSLQVARDERERAQCTDKGSCLLPIVVTLAVMRAWGCGCGLYSDGGVETWTRRLRLRNASDVDQDRPRSTQELRGLTRTIMATIAYHQRIHISIVAIVIRHCISTLNSQTRWLGFSCLSPLSASSRDMPATQPFDRQP